MESFDKTKQLASVDRRMLLLGRSMPKPKHTAACGSERLTAAALLLCCFFFPSLSARG